MKKPTQDLLAATRIIHEAYAKLKSERSMMAADVIDRARDWIVKQNTVETRHPQLVGPGPDRLFRVVCTASTAFGATSGAWRYLSQMCLEHEGNGHILARHLRQIAKRLDANQRKRNKKPKQRR